MTLLANTKGGMQSCRHALPLSLILPHAALCPNFHGSSRSMPVRRIGRAGYRRAIAPARMVLVQDKPPAAAPPPPPQGPTDVVIKIYTHRNMEKEKGFKPRLSLTLISEDPEMEERPTFDATEWAYEQVPRQSGSVEGFGDLGTIFYATVQLPAGFGRPGVLLVQKQENPVSVGGVLGGLLGRLGESPKESILGTITDFVDPQKNHRIYIGTVAVGGTTFHCHSAVHEAQGQRIFFTADAKLRKDTPAHVEFFRKKELAIIQGKDSSNAKDADKPRKGPDRIYDYQAYNDLGNPQKSPDLARPVLGGDTFPFPRRLRTGRPLIEGTPYESQPPKPALGLPIGLPWLPYDEQFNETKTFGFLGDELRAGINQIPSKIGTLVHNLGDQHEYRSLHAVDALFTEPDDNDAKSGIISLRGKAAKVFDKLDDFWQASKFKLPRVRRNRQLVWTTDEEFGRQYLAGQHPCFIQQVTREWMEEVNAVKPVFTDETIGGVLDGKSLSERLSQGGRLFRADYVPVFEDYISRVNAQKQDENKTVPWLTKDRCLHAGRALFYYTDNGYLVPIAIELRKAKGEVGTVYTPYDAKELWQLAKETIASLDCAYHQLVSHYLRAHACQEPFIIATMRNLSALHPVYKLMLPHFRYTMHINANARSILINADGTLEQTFTSGKYTMELASVVYEKLYHFETQSLEADLILRGMVKMNDEEPVRDKDGKLVPVVDYPFAEDGLDIWMAMKEWFGEYLAIYYPDDKTLADDVEIQAWWKELKERGHPDKKDGWPPLETVTDLRDILTTIAFTGSAHHAAVNFAQYDYSGYMVNRPALIRRPIPEKGSPGVKELESSYESELLSYLPNPDDALQAALLYVVLSSHAPNEEYLDHAQPQWIENEQALSAHEKFLAALKKLDEDITARNGDASNKIRSTVGARGIPYELLRPNSGPGVTSRGVPCSTSI